MPWRDPARLDESAEDQILRSEMRLLLGLPGDGPFFDAEPTPELIQLAERLRSEANRRRRTSRQRPTWLLVAAAVPFLVALGALGNWGLQHKRRADQLAAAQVNAPPPATLERNRDLDRTSPPAGTPSPTFPVSEPALQRHEGRELRPSEATAAERLQAMNAPGRVDREAPVKHDADPRRARSRRSRRPGELVIPAEPVHSQVSQPAHQVKDRPR